MMARPLRIEYEGGFYHVTSRGNDRKDKNNNLTTLTYPGSKIVNYQYDKANRLIKVTDWLSNVTTYTYDLAVNLIKTTYPDSSAIEYRYDNASRLKSIIDSKPDGSLNAAYNYSFDQLGNRTTISSYQPVNAIPSLPDTSYTHNTDNRLVTAGSTTFEYDNNGNLITKTLGGNVTNYTWDFNDMLTQVTANGNTYTYRYDGLGNRVARIENSVEKRYVGGLAETDASGNITAYYVYGLGLISKITPSNQSYFYHFDGLGSTVGISDLTGSVVNKYAYDAFGKVLSQDEGIPNPFKYVGGFGVMDEGNGILYMRARYYDPEVGRFISKDPIGLAGGLNQYTYVVSNPVNLTDPNGLEPLISVSELAYQRANRTYIGNTSYAGLCNQFVYAVYRDIDYPLTGGYRLAAFFQYYPELRATTNPVRGDIVQFLTAAGAPYNHVAIYSGNGNIITTTRAANPSTQGAIVEISITRFGSGSPYLYLRYVGR